MNVITASADAGWLYAIYEYCAPYYEEGASHLGLTPSKDAATDTFWSALVSDEADILVCMNDYGIAGVLALVTKRTFFKGREADIEFFYVRPEHRGSGSSRKLVEAVLDYGHERGIDVIYGGVQNGMGKRNNGLYLNLFKKYGFVELGSMICKKGM